MFIAQGEQRKPSGGGPRPSRNLLFGRTEIDIALLTKGQRLPPILKRAAFGKATYTIVKRDYSAVPLFPLLPDPLMQALRSYGSSSSSGPLRT